MHTEEYARITEYFSRKWRALDAPSSALSPLSWDDIINIIDDIRRLITSKRCDVVEAIRQKPQKKCLVGPVVSNAVDLAASLWLTIAVRSTSEVLHAGFLVLGWPEE